MGKLMKRTLIILVSILSMPIIIIIGCITLLYVAGSLYCLSDVSQEVLSPNGKLKVVVFDMNCGATTGFSTHISLLNSNIATKNRTTAGNIFRADGHPDEFRIDVKWEGDKLIIIEHNGIRIPYFTKEIIRGIKIQYFENTEGFLPPKPFMSSELFLSASCFPAGLTSEEMRRFDVCSQLNASE